MNQNLLLIGLLIGALFFLRPQTAGRAAADPWFNPGGPGPDYVPDWRDLG